MALGVQTHLKLADVKVGEQYKLYEVLETVPRIVAFTRVLMGGADPYGREATDLVHGNWHTDPEEAARNIFGAPVNYGLQTCAYIGSGFAETFGTGVLRGGMKTYVKLANPVRHNDLLSINATAVDRQESDNGISVTWDVMVEDQNERVCAVARVRVREGDIDIFEQPLEELPEVSRPEQTERVPDSDGVYEYEDAKVGEQGPPFVYMVTREGIARYSEAAQSFHPLHHEVAEARAQGFPDVVGHLNYGLHAAPNGRMEIIAKNGLDTPHNHPTNPHATPFARLDYNLYRLLVPGDLIVSTTRVADKYIRKGRKYIAWGVRGVDQHDEVVVDYIYTCLWDRGREADKKR